MRGLTTHKRPIIWHNHAFNHQVMAARAFWPTVSQHISTRACLAGSPPFWANLCCQRLVEGNAHPNHISPHATTGKFPSATHFHATVFDLSRLRWKNAACKYGIGIGFEDFCKCRPRQTAQISRTHTKKLATQPTEPSVLDNCSINSQNHGLNSSPPKRFGTNAR